MDRTISVSEARDGFAELVNSVAYGKDRVVLKRRNKKLMALVPIEDLELIEAIEDAIDREEIARIKSDPDQQWVPLEELVGEFDE